MEHLKSLIAISISILITISCSGGGSSGTPTGIQITFPTKSAITESDKITIYGTASKVSEVKVNGVIASSSDSFKHWSAVVALSNGDNAINITTNLSNISTQASIKRVGTFIVEPTKLAHDISKNRLLVLDRDKNSPSVISIKLDTGERQILSDNNPQYGDITFYYPRAIAIDSINNRLLVVNGDNPQNSYDGVIAVDLDTGIKTMVTNVALNATDIVFNSSNPDEIIALMNSNNTGSLIRYNLTSGSVTTISDTDTPAAPDNTDLFIKPYALALDNNRVLVFNQGQSAILAVALDTGKRTVVSSNTFPDTDNPLGYIYSLSLDTDLKRVLVLSSNLQTSSLISIDLATGKRTLISNDAIPDSNNPFLGARLIQYNPATEQAYVVGGLKDRITSVDINTGQRTVLSESGTTNGGITLNIPQVIELDKARNRAIVWDGNIAGLITVDLDTGIRTFLNEVSSQQSELLNDFAINPETDELLAVNYFSAALISINLKDNTRTTISAANNENLIMRPGSIALAPNERQAYIADSDLKAIISVDLDSGAQKILSNETIPDNTNLFESPGRMDIDKSNNRLLVSDHNTDSITAVDLSSGQRTIFSANQQPGSTASFTSINTVAVDSSHNRALVGDYFTSSLISVDLDTGVRKVFSDSSTPDNKNRLKVPSHVVIDSQNNVAFVIDMGMRAVMIVHLETGERAIVSK